MALIRRLSLVQRTLLVGAALCVILGLATIWMRDVCVNTYFADIIGCKNSAYDIGIYAMNIAGALIMTFLIFFQRYPRILGLVAIVQGLILIWVGDMGSFFGGLFSLTAGLLSLTSLL